MISKKAENILVILIAVVVFLLGAGLTFILLSSLWWLICWALGLTFSFKAVVGVWAILILLKLLRRKG